MSVSASLLSVAESYYVNHPAIHIAGYTLCCVTVTGRVNHYFVSFCVSVRFCLYLAFSACDSDTIRDVRWCYRLHAVRPAKESWCCCAGDSLLSAFQLLTLPLQSAEGGRRGSQSDSLSFPLLTTCDKS